MAGAMNDEEWSTKLNLLKDVNLNGLYDFQKLFNGFDRNLKTLINNPALKNNILLLIKLRASIIDLTELTLKATDVFENSRTLTNEKLLDRLNNLLLELNIEIPEISSSLTEFFERSSSNEAFLEKIKKVTQQANNIIENEHFKMILKVALFDYEMISKASVVENEIMPFDHYLGIANSFNLADKDFLSAIDAIMEPVKYVFVEIGEGTAKKIVFIAPNSPKSYTAIVGPSFMGKTQFSFILARKMPVFYFNFSLSEKQQAVYKQFQPIREPLLKAIQSDMIILENSIESNIIYSKSSTKLFTIGFIWNLIQYSSKFQGSFSNGEWFKYYLTSRRLVFEPLSLTEFYNLMENFVKNSANFKIPVIFIDELPTNAMEYIKYLRNIVRCLVLPCILSSTNAKVSNMLNMRSTSSNNDYHLWVTALIWLFKANLEGILRQITIGTAKLFDFVDKWFNLKKIKKKFSLLQYLGIESSQFNSELLLKIWEFLKSQSFNNLQGTSFYSFLYFAKELSSYSGKHLDSRKIWEAICIKISASFRGRKEVAFSREGRYFSMRMFCTTRKLGGNTSAVKRENLEDGSETQVQNSIDKHFYYFGAGNEKTNALPFTCSDAGKLQLLTESANHVSVDYEIRSHYKSFEADFFTSIALWTVPEMKPGNSIDSVAMISKSHNMKLIKDPALNMDFKVQKIVAHWSAAHSSHQNYFGETSGIDFIKLFAENIQLQVDNSYPHFETSETEGIFPVNLAKYLKLITVPYLVPDMPKMTFESSLNGLCRLGTCLRLPNLTGFDIEFQFYKRNNVAPSNGYIECKYTETPQSLDDVTVYIDRARHFKIPLTILLTYNLGARFKTVNNLHLKPRQLRENVKQVIETEKSVKTVPRKRRHEDNFKLNAYSIYLDGSLLKCIPLYETEATDPPDGVFIIIETNFDVPSN